MLCTKGKAFDLQISTYLDHYRPYVYTLINGLIYNFDVLNRLSGKTSAAAGPSRGVSLNRVVTDRGERAKFSFICDFFFPLFRGSNVLVRFSEKGRNTSRFGGEATCFVLPFMHVGWCVRTEENDGSCLKKHLGETSK